MNETRTAGRQPVPAGLLDQVALANALEDASRYRPPADPRPAWMIDNERNIQELRRRGVKIGEDCVIFTNQFSLEPYLVEIGDGVGISGGTMFLTHDGAAWLLRRRGRAAAQHFGRIVVGSETYIGQNCLILPGTTIGARCVIGAGAVVRGSIPENSVVIGNPCQVVGRTSLLLEMMDSSPNTLDSFHLPASEREAMLRRHFGLD